VQIHVHLTTTTHTHGCTMTTEHVLTTGSTFIASTWRLFGITTSVRQTSMFF